MWKCNDCGRLFEEPNEKYMSIADYYGVDEKVGLDRHFTLQTCPLCKSEDIDELDAYESRVLTDKGLAEGDRYPDEELD
jgi:hypothetical protein